MNKLKIFFTILLTVGLTSTIISKKKFKIATGQQGQTYYHIGLSFKSLGYKALPLTTRGSVQNIRLVERAKADFGMVQSDILIAMLKDDKSLAKKIKLVLPIYDEEVHIMTSLTVNSLNDLKGKRVNIGPSGSGIRGTSNIILKTIGVEVNKNKSKTMNALFKMYNKEIDALIIVSGSPVEMLAGIGSEAKNKFKLLQISDEEFSILAKSNAYKRATIPNGTYPWVAGEINTFSVSSILITSAKAKNSDITNLLKKIFKKKKKLISSHKKWSELNKKSAKKQVEQFKGYYHPSAVKFFK